MGVEPEAFAAPHNAAQSAGDKLKTYAEQSENARKAIEYLKSLKSRPDSGELKVPERLWEEIYKHGPGHTVQRFLNNRKPGQAPVVDSGELSMEQAKSDSDEFEYPVAPGIDSTLPPPKPPAIEPDWDSLYPTPVAPAPHPLPDAPVPPPPAFPRAPEAYTPPPRPKPSDPDYDSIFDEINRRSARSGSGRKRK